MNNSENNMLKFVKENNINLITYKELKNTTNKNFELTMACNCGNTFKLKYPYIIKIKDISCDKCRKKNRNLKAFYVAKEKAEVFGLEMLSNSENFEGYNSDLLVKCTCGNEFITNSMNINIGVRRYCAECMSESYREKREYGKKEIESIIIKYTKSKLISFFKTDDRLNIELQCTCGNTYITNIANLTRGRSKVCKRCSMSMSKSERDTEDILKNNNIEYIKEKTFNGCVNICKLRFDFYLPKYNLAIELNGIQHYESVGLFGGEKGFESTKFRDNIKIKYCQDNDVNLLIIPYNDFNRIEELIKYKI